MKRFAFAFIILLGLAAQSSAQTFHQEKTETIMIQGHTFKAVISGTDTIIMVDLEDVEISSPLIVKL